MRTAQAFFKSKVLFKTELNKLHDIDPHLLFIFGSSLKFGKFGPVAKIAKEFPKAVILGCSTAGEISNDGVFDESIVVNGVHFENSSSRVLPFSEPIASLADSFQAGQRIIQKIDKKGLRGICILSPGLQIDGAELVRGLQDGLGGDLSVPVFGGLAGDGANFAETRTLLNGETYSRNVVGFGIYGDRIDVDCNYMGGWKPFGKPMRITKSAGNVVYSINNEPALAVYSSVLGDEAISLPSSGLKFPMLILNDENETDGIVRTPLSIDKNEMSVILAGSVKQGSWMRVMQTNLSDLTAAAANAARPFQETNDPSFALLVSCVGRKLVMKEKTSDEVSAIKSVVGENCQIGGFYSYGEICPGWEFKACSLHNETMTISRIRERLVG